MRTKKIISLIVVTAFILSAMITTVNAAVGQVTPATETTPRKIELNFENPSYSLISATGEYTLVDRAGVSHDVGSITAETILGTDFRNYIINPFTIKYDAGSEITPAGADYIRMYPFSGDVDANITDKTIDESKGIQGIGSTAGFLGVMNKGESALYYSFYAYSETTTGSTLDIFAANNGSFAGIGAVSLSASDLYSANRIPHKVDVVCYSTDTDNTSDSNDYVHMAVYVDGLFKNSTVTAISGHNKGLRLVAYFNMGPFNQNLGTGKSSTATNMHISYVGDEKISGLYQGKTRTAIENQLITDPSWANGSSNQQTSATFSGFVTGFKPAVNASVEKALTVATTGDKTVNVEGATLSDIIDSSVANPTVEILNRTTGATIDRAAYATTPISDALFKVRGVYVIPIAFSYEDANVNPFPIEGNSNSIRTLLEHYTESNKATKPFGGLDKGFYKLTNEAYTEMKFTNGAPQYNAGFYGLACPGDNANSDKGTDAYNKTRYMTLAFTAYIPEFTMSNSVNSYSFQIAPGWASTGRDTLPTLELVTNENDTNSGARILVDGNAWSNIRLEFDFSETEASGTIKYSVYVNDILKNTFTKTSEVFKKMLNEQHTIAFNYIRIYMPEFYSIGIIDNAKWYYGKAGNANSMSASTAQIENNIANAVVDEVNSKIIADTDIDSLTVAMAAKGYLPVYGYTYKFRNDIRNAYVSTDGYRHTGKLIKKWLIAEGYLSESSVPDANGTYTSLKTDAGIVSITAVEGDSESVTIETTSSFSTAAWQNVWIPVEELFEENPSLCVRKLLGYSVTESGKIPRVYTVEQTEHIAVDAASKSGTLYLNRINGNITSGKLFFAAYSNTGAMLDVKSADVATEIKKLSGNDREITLQFTDIDAASYRVFLFDSFDTLVPLLTQD